MPPQKSPDTTHTGHAIGQSRRTAPPPIQSASCAKVCPAARERHHGQDKQTAPAAAAHQCPLQVLQRLLLRVLEPPRQRLLRTLPPLCPARTGCRSAGRQKDPILDRRVAYPGRTAAFLSASLGMPAGSPWAAAPALRSACRPVTMVGYRVYTHRTEGTPDVSRHG